MSYNCNRTPDNQFPCQCDSFEHPLKLNIGAGLTELPRQIASFSEFRQAMLYAIRPADASEKHKLSLLKWKARHNDDLGIMLLEMWAYVCDAVSFYDKVIAQEVYLRTANQRPSLRRLVALLGYLPKPAVGSIVFLSAIAEGRKLLKLPAGTAFRSKGFDGNPPQVFELEQEQLIHPLMNQWPVLPPVINTNTASNPTSILILPASNIKADNPLLIIDNDEAGYSQVRFVQQVSNHTGSDGKLYRKIEFDDAINLPKGYVLDGIKLFTPIQHTGLWTVDVLGNAATISADQRTIVLDGVHASIKAGQYIVVTRNEQCRWFKVSQASVTTRKLSAGEKVVINRTEFETPGITIPVTQLVLDKGLNSKYLTLTPASTWHEAIKAELTVYFDMQIPGVIANEPAGFLTDTDQIIFGEKPELPVEHYTTSTFFLLDKNQQGVQLNGELNYSRPGLQPGMGEKWSPALTMPVEAFGNVIKATRGETVLNEILGSGNASLSYQTYQLKKKPLTYFATPSMADDQGVSNTLKVYVNGVRWKEVRGFYNKKPDEQVYIVRQNDEGDSFITFGDGNRGMRLPTGTDNIIATYRYGAEEATPPAGTVTQISKPVTGLTEVNNPLSAEGGGGRELPEQLRTYAPKSILTLGRVVSILDADAIAHSVPGVRAAQVEWRWHGEQQCPVMVIWYSGKPGIEDTLKKRIRALSDPALLVKVELAMALPLTISIDVHIDDRFITDEVLVNVRNTLVNKENGLLTPENIGIGAPVFRSKIFSAVQSVSGVLSVRHILWNGQSFTGFARSPGQEDILI
ncbi:hypothetical protein [Hymenobacter volaticus]|uniref:Baseplate protein J-like domain-containing protein n=1 Tax=Hymenobacter volaticus TaxID=2932254 RepID=A0ABY4G1Y2_9BACT|nr:hypothetical protein [Hymenobacter volaticus]UOQ64807.1 hypothetical protein MUN86_14680 [Hymenobacter volaticus]